MKQVLTFLILCCFVPGFGQQVPKNDIVGKWKIVRCELLEENKLIKTIYVKESQAKPDTVIEGPDIGQIDEGFYVVLKAFIGSVITFKEDNNCTWKVKIKELEFTDKYWVLNTVSNEIKICEWSDKDKLIPLIMGFTIVRMEKDKLFLRSDDSGAGMKFDLIRLE